MRDIVRVLVVKFNDTFYIKHIQCGLSKKRFIVKHKTIFSLFFDKLRL